MTMAKTGAKTTTKEITDIQRDYSLGLVVKLGYKHNVDCSERWNNYLVFFEGSITRSMGAMIGYIGEGLTVDNAIISYCKLIEKKELHINVEKFQRIVIKMPKLIHTKLYNEN